MSDTDIREEWMSSTTTDKGRYIEAWTSHIENLGRIGYPLIKAGDGLFDELTRIQDRLEELLKIAAKVEFDDN